MRKNIIVSLICFFVLSVFIAFIILSGGKDGSLCQKRSGNNFSENRNNDIVVEFLDSPVNLSGYSSDTKQNRKIKEDKERASTDNKTENDDETKLDVEKIEDTERPNEINGRNGKDGKDGRDGIDGKDGINGRDGINGKDGKDGVDGKNGQDGKDGKNGVNGKDGKNPQKGIDYFTSDEKREIVEDVVKEVYGLADNGEIMFSAENAYEVWLHNHEGTEEDFFEFLKGEKGDKGDKGDEGIIKISEYTADYDEAQNTVIFKCVTNNNVTENID